MTPRSAKKIALKLCKPYYADNGFDRWMFPIIQLMAADDLIYHFEDVQPMTDAEPGLTFYMDFVRDSRWERLKRWLRRTLRLPPFCRPSRGPQPFRAGGTGLVFKM